MQTVTTSTSQGPDAAIACPKCGHVHNLDFHTPDQDNRMTTVLCSCGETFLVVLDARQFERKTVAIKGMYTVMNDSGLGGLVSLRDLDPEHLSPLDALKTLMEWKQLWGGKP